MEYFNKTILWLKHLKHNFPFSFYQSLIFSRIWIPFEINRGIRGINRKNKIKIIRI